MQEAGQWGFLSVLPPKSESPILYIPIAIVLILDGGLGLLKVSLIRLFHIHILTKVRTPPHDHVRKNMMVKHADGISICHHSDFGFNGGGGTDFVIEISTDREEI